MHAASSQSLKSTEDIFAPLNPKQKDAAEEIDKPLLIIAGAGSGKTLTVASKIAYLIQQGMKPENILALAFNQKAAEELKERVLSMVENAEDLSISTFHSFCNQFIQDNILNTKLNANFKVITDTAQLVFLTKNINSFGIKHLEFNHDPYTLAEEMKKFISRCKDESITTDDIQQYVEKQEKEALDEEAQEDLNNLKDILKIYRSYENYKLQNNMLDFGDMLCIVYDLLKTKPILLKRYQEKFQYIIVDEFQDTNYIQLQVVHLIANKNGHITVVGDDDQSIYRFRGAYITNIAEFKKMFPNYVEKALEQNYRSTKKILAVANTLIANSPERTIKTLFTTNSDGEKVSVVETQTDSAQANFILKTIKELLKTYSRKDIAVLCRRRASAEPIIDALRKHCISFNFVGETGFFQEPIIKDVLAYLKVASNPAENNAELARILHRYVFNVKPIDMSKFCGFANHKHISLYETLDYIDKIKVDRAKFLKAKEVIYEITQSKTKAKTLELIHKLLFEVEFYKYEIALQNKRNIQLLNQFYAFAEEFNKLYPESDLDGFSDYLSYASNFEIEEQNIEEETITVSTIHGVKGMQFPVVIIPDLVERKLPTTFQKDKFAIPEELLKGVKSQFDNKELHVQEERRLFYVAITRAKEKLIITLAKRYGENKTDSKPSKFLKEVMFDSNNDINFEHVEVEELDVEGTTKEKQISTILMKETLSALNARNFTMAIEKVLLIAKSTCKDMDIKAEIIDKIKEPDYTILQQTGNGGAALIPENPVFSISQFNTYKRCPRIYNYSYLLKIPGKPKYFFDFGASIHNVVEDLTKNMKEGTKADYTVALELLEKHWETTGYKSKIDEERDYEEAKQILKVFLEEQSKLKTQIVEIERWFETKVEDVNIRGRIDRIDKDGNEYVVIDYKTSKKVSSEKEIKQDMQLLLYSMVTEDLFGKKPSKIGIWYLRPNEKKFVEIENEALNAIKAEIKEIATKIKAGIFDPTPGWECRNCDYDCLCDIS